MATVPDSNKTKIAKRVIEVFEFFADGNRRATVMDIVRRYGRPQSSTSELLSALVEMGLLYKDPFTRSFGPTPRLAALGFSAQPELIGSGRLFAYMDRLSQASRHGVALFGMVGTQLQIFHWTAGAGLRDSDLNCGAICPLSSSAAGLLILSALGTAQASKMLWRLNAEMEEEAKFNLSEANQRVARFGQLGHATGESGLLPHAKVTAVLLPDTVAERPLALGVIYAAKAAVDPDALVATLKYGVGQCLSPDADASVAFARTLVAV